MKKNCFVGFDTSNYTTSAAVCNEEGRIIANIRFPLPVASGEKGLRQSDAVFAHIKNLPPVCEELRGVVTDMNVVGVGVSTRPRSVEGSYMPCFLSGIAAANSFAAGIGAPICEFSHQDGHVMAALYSSGEAERLLGGSFLALHLSGGTTELLLARPSDDTLFSLDLIGETEDISAGQLIDRIGVMMGLSFPCGKDLEALAGRYEGKLTKPKITVRDKEDKLVCNLSGVENIATRLYKDGASRELVAATVFDHVEKTVSKMCEMALSKYGNMPILFAGGVMSNKLMRAEFGKKFDACFAEAEFSADNASGIALLCRYKMISNN